MHHPLAQSCTLQLSVALCIGLLAGCGSSGGDAAPSAAPPPAPGLAGIQLDEPMALVMTEVHDLRVDLTTANFAIDDQTFVRVYRVDEDGSEHLIAVKRLRPRVDHHDGACRDPQRGHA